MPRWTPSSSRTESQPARRLRRRCRPGHLLGGPEWLEDRRLLAQGVISGVVFGDLDGGGTRSPGEAGLSGWTVYLDANLNGSLDAGEASTASAADGSYSLAADPGFYFVREVPKPGFQRTAPAGGDHALLIVSGVARTGIDFGNQPIVPGTISGVVFRDADSDGLRGAGEGGLSGWTVYLDTNFNEAPDAGEPSAISAADGSYRIAASPGFYLVREVVKPSYLLTYPATNAQFADLTTGRAVTNLNFGNYSPLPPATISGVVYADADGNGVRDAGEGPLAGWTVYLDANGDGSLDAGEASHVTDATGLYSFSVAGGSYTVRQVAQAGYQTAPASGAYAVTVADGDTAAGRDFGNRPAAVVGDGTISGVVYADADGDGTRDAGEPALAGWTVFLDRNLNGVREAGEPATTTDAAGAYRFTVEAGTYVVREVVQAGYAQTAPASVAYIVTVSSASPATGRDFGNAPPAPSGKGTISGVVYDDADGDGTRDAGEEGLPNWEVYLDLNGSGAPSPASRRPARTRRGPIPSPSTRGRTRSARSCRPATAGPPPPPAPTPWPSPPAGTPPAATSATGPWGPTTAPSRGRSSSTSTATASGTRGSPGRPAGPSTST